MRHLAILAALAAIFAPPALAQNPSRTDTVGLTLEAAVQRALDQGTEMRVARAQLMDASGQVRQAFADALPQVNGSLVYTRQFASIYQTANTGSGGDTSITNLFKNSPFGAPNSWNAQFTASQVLFSRKVGAGLKAARAVREGTTAQRDETAAQTAYQVKRAYLQVQYASRVLEVSNAGLDEARRELHQVQLYQQAGTRAEYDLLRAQVDAANQEPLVVQAKNDCDLALLEFKRLVNIPADQPVALTTSLESPDGTIPAVADEDLGLPERPALAAAEAAVQARQQLLNAAIGGRWPTLTVSTTFSEQAFPQQVSPLSSTFRRNWNAAVTLSLPIFTGFRTEGSIEQARAQLDQARAQRDQTKQQVDLDLAQARAELGRTRSLLAARRETVRQAQRAQHLASVRYANGLSTQLEVADARLLAQRSEVNEAQTRLDYLLALAQLERALGRPVPVERRPVQQAARLTPEREQQQ